MLNSKQKQISLIRGPKLKSILKIILRVGHGFDHAIRVSQNAALIAKKKRPIFFVRPFGLAP